MNNAIKRFGNRVISAAVAAVLAMTAVTIPVFADEEELQTVFINDFSTYADGAVPSESGWTVNNNEVLSIKDGAIAIVQDFTNTNINGKAATKTLDSAVSGKLTLETEYDLSGVTKGEVHLLILNGAGGEGYRFTYGSNKVYVTVNKSKLLNVDVSGYKNKLSAKAVIDTSTQTFDLYLTETGNEYPPEPQGKQLQFNTTNINKLNFNSGWMDGTAKLKKIALYRVVKNSAPSVSDVKITEKNGVLTGNYTYSDSDNDAEGESVYKWYVKNGESFDVISGAESKTLELTEADSGKTFKFGIVPKDIKGLAGAELQSEEFTYTYVKPIVYDMPSAEVQATSAKGAVLIGNYSFTCDNKITGDDIDKSEYQWYIADKLFGDYIKIDGATGREYIASKQTSGKFIKFSVTPVDKEGNRGETKEAFPVMQTEGTYLDFENGYTLTDGWEKTQQDNGKIFVGQDPVNSLNNVLEISRNSNNKIEGGAEAGITLADYRFTSPGTKTVISADVYAGTERIVCELFYVLVSGGAQAYKVYLSGNNLIGAGGNGMGTQISETLVTGFERKKWHNLRLEFDASDNTVDCYVDGELKNQKKGWRANGTGVTGIRSFLQATNIGFVCIDNVTIAGVMDYSNDVFKDTESLNIPEDLNEVMTDVTLNQSGENGTVISWHSSNPSVISDDGKVTRPSVGQPDTEVTLTAYIMKGTYIETKTFKANVMRLLDDSESTKKDAEKLESYKNMILDVDISLPMEGANSTSIEWRSSNPSVLSNDGRINPNDTDERVIMTAIITRGDKSSSTEIPFYVLKKSTKNLMKDGKFSISSQETKNPITNINDGDLKTSWRASAADTNPVFEIDLGKKLDFTDLLIINGDSSINGIKISISDDASVWKSAGGFEATAESKINRFNFAEPNNSGRYMRIETDGTGQPEIYELRLCNNPSDDKRVETDLNSLELEPSKTAQGSFDLPLVLENGSSVKWTSSNENIIKIDLNGKATVTPGQSTQIVTLTAEISYGKVTKQKTFGITVSGTGGGSSGGGSSSGGSGSSGGGIPWNGTSDSANNSNNSGNFSEFEDLESVPWVIEAVMTLKNKGIVNGVNDKEFAPNESITREEFAAMAVRAFNLPTVDLNDELFVDVPQNMWYNTVVAAAYNAGIIKGRDDGSFGAGEKITREDMVVMLYRAAKLSGYKSIEFKDGDSVSDYAAEAVRELSAAGIITGDESGFFRPKATATRAEAAVMIYRIINR